MSEYKLLYFGAEWCQPCKQFGPVVVDMVAHFSLPLEKHDVEEQEGKLAAQYGISSIPALVLLRGDEVIAQRSGSCAGGELRSWLNLNIK